MGFKFQTEVGIPRYFWKTGYKKQNFFLGSCFTENVGNKMEALKFPVELNPFGILYNPVSVANCIRAILQKKNFSIHDLIHHDGLWHSFYHHSRFSSNSAGKAQEGINRRVESSAEVFKRTEFLFITFGTAWVYIYQPTGLTVSNCHKIPEKNFKRLRLTPEEIVEDYQKLLPEIWEIQPTMKVIFTVSPVRHWKDGAIENQRSKAALLLAVESLVKFFGQERCSYFPAYEIVMDELRDYRFYEPDMIHPSPVAISHIWEKFRSALIDDESQKISEEVEKLIHLFSHRPFNRFSPEYLDFLQQSMKKVQELQEKFPYLDVSSELKNTMEQIAIVKEGINKI